MLRRNVWGKGASSYMVSGMSESPQQESGRSETALVKEVRAGRQEAYEALVRMHQDRVFSVLRRCVRSDEVEDLAQELFVRAFEKIDQFRGEARFGTYLMRILRNMLIDRHRRIRRSPGLVALAEETGDPADAHLPDPAPGPVEKRELGDRARAVAAALAKLEPKDRLLLILRDSDGMSSEEAGKVIGCSPGAVRIRLFRARRKMRKHLSSEILNHE